jgi:mono/diheme cytochrome c family protein
MLRLHLFSWALASSIVLALSSLASADDQKTADLVQAGHSFALKVCWACHVTGKDQVATPILSDPAPSFLEIAQRPNLNEAALRKFLSTHNATMGTNSKMPNPRLVDYQIDEIVAYLISLKN